MYYSPHLPTLIWPLLCPAPHTTHHTLHLPHHHIGLHSLCQQTSEMQESVPAPTFPSFPPVMQDQGLWPGQLAGYQWSVVSGQWLTGQEWEAASLPHLSSHSTLSVGGKASYAPATLAGSTAVLHWIALFHKVHWSILHCPIFHVWPDTLIASTCGKL